MNKNIFIPALLTLLFFFAACTPGPEKAFQTLKQLNGRWKSTGNVVLFERWQSENDSSLSGYTFSKQQNGRLLILERYRLERNTDSLYFVILRPEKSSGEDRYPLVEARFGSFTFENPNAAYPNRVILDFEDDSVFVKRTENLRGNKGIEFEMKRW